MANFNLVIDSRFKPFSYSEIIAPLAQQTEEHNLLEEQYNELNTKANVWEGMADKVRDRKTYEQYQKYVNDLKEQASILAREGLNVNSRRSLGNMKTRYSSEIVPIEQAYNAREAEKKRQAETYDRDDSIMFSRNASTTSLDDYLGGNITPYKQASGRKLTADVISQAGNLAKVLRNYGVGARIDNFTKTFLKQYGFTPSEVQMAINNPKDARSSKVLNAIIDSTINASGIKDWKNQSLLNRSYDYAREGLWAAIGQNQVSQMEDYASRYRLQHPQSPDLPINPLSELSHWDYESDSAAIPPELKVFKGLKNKLVSKIGAGLSQDYIGKTFNNPMKIYEEAVEYAKKHPLYEKGMVGVNPNYGTSRYEVIDYSMSNAIKAIKKKYGVKDILSESDYEAMKKLGYTSKSKFEEMAGTNLSDRINQQIVVNAPTSTNLSKYDWANEKIKSTLKTWSNEDDEPVANDYKNKKERIKYSDIFGEDDKKNISNISYSLKTPDKIIITVDGKNVLVSPSAISAEVAEVLKWAKDRSRYANSNKLKGQLQDITTFKIRQLLNNYGQVRTESSSKI